MNKYAHGRVWCTSRALQIGDFFPLLCLLSQHQCETEWSSSSIEVPLDSKNSPDASEMDKVDVADDDVS